MRLSAQFLLVTLSGIKKKNKIRDCPNHPSNFHPDNMQNFYLDNTPKSIKSKFYLHMLHLKKMHKDS